MTQLQEEQMVPELITPQGKAAYPPKGWTERLMCTQHPGETRTCQNCQVINCARATACIWCAAQLPQAVA